MECPHNDYLTPDTCSNCLGRLRRINAPETKASRPHTATGPSREEVQRDIETLAGLDPHDVTTSGLMRAFLDSLVARYALPIDADLPMGLLAEQVALLGDADWDADCSTSRSHVTLKGHLRLRDAIVNIHRQHS